MPWGCIGDSQLGNSGPGTPNCGLFGTLVIVATAALANFSTLNTAPRPSETFDSSMGKFTATDTIPRKPETF